MTLANATLRVRKIARASTLSHTDAEVMNAINEGLRQFSVDTNGNLKETYLALAPRFDSATNWALTMAGAGATASFTITGTARTDATGGTIASDLQVAIQAATTAWATSTVSWSATTWKFTINVDTATSVVLSAPTRVDYVDALDTILGGGNTQTGSSWVSTLPIDSTIETDLPTDFMSANHVEWDGRPLSPTTIESVVSPSYMGRPTNYHVINRRMRLYPAPSTQELFHVWYEAKHTEFVSATQTTTDIPLNPPYDDAVVFYAASSVAEELDEIDKANLNRAKYRDRVQSFNVNTANQNPKKRAPDQGFVRPQWILVSES